MLLLLIFLFLFVAVISIFKTNGLIEYMKENEAQLWEELGKPQRMGFNDDQFDVFYNYLFHLKWRGHTNKVLVAHCRTWFLLYSTAVILLVAAALSLINYHFQAAVNV